MKVFESSDVRNVALLGHGHCGKTSLASALLYTGGATDRLTSPAAGNAPTDFDDEEVARGLSISSAVAAFPWQNSKINLIDTPGYNIFLGDTQSAQQVADAVLVLLDGVAGVEVGTERVWQFASEFAQPRCLVVNKLDRERADFQQVVAGAQQAFGRAAVPVQLPIGSEKNLTGVIDLIRMRAYCYKPGGQGKGAEGEIPTPYEEAAATAHEALVEMVAEGNDDLMNEFFGSGTLPQEHIVSGLQQAVRECRLFPILCANAGQNMGTDLLLNFIAEILPSPFDVLPASHRPAVSRNGGSALFVFKTMVDPFSGRISYFKVLSGSIRNETQLQNARTGMPEKLSHLATPLGKTLVPVNALHAGDVGAVAKLKDTLTGDTLCEKTNGASFKAVELPEPAIAYAIATKSHQDEERLSTALHKMLEEDRALRFYRDPQTKEFLLAGNGQQHLEIVVSRLKRRYNVDVALHAPKIPYRETIRGAADVQGRHKKQSGGHGQFGDCWIKMEPLPRGARFEFVNEIFGGSIPKQYVPAVEKGILEAAERGSLAGYPVVDFRVVLYDGSYHEVDSSEMAFKIAGRKAFRAAMQQARPALLEPVMTVDIETPVDFAGDLMSDLNGRRGRISGMEIKGSTQLIHAQVPMAEMLTYQTDLISKTQGRASFRMEFDHYDFVPPAQAEKVIAAAKAHVAHVEEEE